MIPLPPPDPRPLGPLLAELRSARGWSQQRVAGALCAASGVPTLTRHEISRWERQRRLPGDFWLGWLAVVLGVPGELLAEAAAHSRRLGLVPATVDRGARRARAALLTLAHRWSADPAGVSLGGPLADPLAGRAAAGPDPGPSPFTRPAAGPGRDGTAGADLAELRHRDDLPGDADLTELCHRDDLPGGADLTELRRWDDLLGGVDLAGAGLRRLRRAVRGYRVAGPAGRHRLLPVLAESAQLAGWLAADAGRLTDGLEVYRLALRAAVAAGDRGLAGHVLGSASHLLAGVGDPAGALVLGRAAYAGCHDAAPPGLRALLLHRIAFAAALAGRSRTARRALTAATDTGGPDPGREPSWLYWLDPAELAAMTGRALVALGRPGPAVPLLEPAAGGAGRPRRAAVYGAWLARAQLRLGEVDTACAVAGAALLDAVRSGSPRAVDQLTEVRRRLSGHRDEPAARRYADLLAAARPWLPARSRPAARARTPRSARAPRRPGDTTGPAGTG
ncbi:helix-turn-helix domain-containing protein [Micromonospora auratinigra]|uniref:Transcriptional regulator, contains XRE-family HTH domain n=1 Tax=Micromonospora auratinigra TaxID=261654 RepID=A0A1A8ZLT3_9ACTN|nr:helix-turn-helix transcriptional regulator [Micromonospora auratinigra]SBT44830.1 Transcriptional regulator, contains XRE-family HTH domain [Micromonospora auratinigra]